MTTRDMLGLTLSGADSTSLAHYENALRQFQCYRGDPLAAVDAALAASPAFVMAHVLKAYLHLLGTEPAGLAVARACYASAARLPATPQEHGHVAVVGRLLAGHWHLAGQTLEDLSIEQPRDILALQAGHQVDFFTGRSRMLRDRIARALPAWQPGMPAYHAVLGMHAFGLEETGDYAAAEAAGRRAVELEPRDGWAQHAVAHVLEMQCRQREGIAWMRTGPQAWAQDSFFQVHNWWHLALFHLELGEIDEVLALFDGPINGAGSSAVLDLVDASALLWRLQLLGVELGQRWQDLAERWQSLAVAGHYAFNDVHAILAFVGAGRAEAACALLEAQQQMLRGNTDNARFTAEVGEPVAQAILAFGDGHYAQAVRLLRPVRAIAQRFGGSHAQRDLLDLTLIEAAFRAGQQCLATALCHERLAVRPESPLSRRLTERAAEQRAA
ncbi:tetratricopeptide repeat protein [Pseudomonas benzenivorans]|uniref:tetratricopeptide repeat protein n=1 Tax=Pseudomonas benzenivorans TaxID=556533 RepID=UPI0021068ABC|nr:tetratricopeptide repeat protein [Pseudomonas benzenivorans]